MGSAWTGGALPHPKTLNIGLFSPHLSGISAKRRVKRGMHESEGNQAEAFPPRLFPSFWGHGFWALHKDVCFARLNYPFLQDTSVLADLSCHFLRLSRVKTEGPGRTSGTWSTCRRQRLLDGRIRGGARTQGLAKAFRAPDLGRGFPEQRSKLTMI